MTSKTIKEVSEMTGFSIPTLRYYEQIGLLDTVDRLANGHRRYGSDDLRRLDFLRRLRATGMSITEMQHYVDLYRQGDATRAERLHILVTHREAVAAQIADLQDTMRFLDTKIERYEGEIRSLGGQARVHMADTA